MHAMNWDDLRYFLAVVRWGSASRAAEQLAVNQTTVSRRIAALETHLRKRLFERSGNHWVITPVGERLVAAAEMMAEGAQSIERQVVADSQELSGKLRVTVADLCSQCLVMPVIKQFCQRYPDVELELIATRDLLDLAAREADVALRSTDTPPPNVVGTRIGRLGYAIYAHPKYLPQLTENLTTGDIPCITWVGDGSSRPPWIERNFPHTRRIYRTTELGLMLEMTRQGLGLAQMPSILVEPDANLRRIPVRYVEPGWDLWVLSHVDLRTTARVRIFRDFLVAALQARKAEIEGQPSSAIR